MFHVEHSHQECRESLQRHGSITLPRSKKQIPRRGDSDRRHLWEGTIVKNIEELNVNVFELFSKDWALLTAGSIGSYNAMTIGWGQLGTLWNKNVVTFFVKPVRFTHGFMDADEYFTVSFYPKEYQRDLTILGSKSGRDGDKIALTRLTPQAAEHGVTFAQARLTLICKKIYRHDMELAGIPSGAAEIYYAKEAPHTIYIGEVTGFVEN